MLGRDKGWRKQEPIRTQTEAERNLELFRIQVVELKIIPLQVQATTTKTTAKTNDQSKATLHKQTFFSSSVAFIQDDFDFDLLNVEFDYRRRRKS